MKDYEIKMSYTMYISTEAESKEEALEMAKQIAEEQHGNRISELAKFIVEGASE